MHVTDGEDVNQQSDKRDKKRVRAAQAIHRESEVSSKRADLEPGPDVIEQRLLATKCAVRFERKIERNESRDCDRAARNQTNKSFVAHMPPNEPIDRCACER